METGTQSGWKDCFRCRGSKLQILADEDSKLVTGRLRAELWRSCGRFYGSYSTPKLSFNDQRRCRKQEIPQKRSLRWRKAHCKVTEIQPRSKSLCRKFCFPSSLSPDFLYSSRLFLTWFFFLSSNPQPVVTSLSLIFLCFVFSRFSAANPHSPFVALCPVFSRQSFFPPCGCCFLFIWDPQP